MHHKLQYLVATVLFSLSLPLFATSSAGTTSSSLDTALRNENVNGGIVNFDAGTVNLTSQVRAVQSDGTFTFVPNANIVINGNNNQLNGVGSSNTRGLFIGGSGANSTGSVTINNLNFVNCTARGGSSVTSGASNNAGGGGGGLGAGGGIFVGQNTNVTLTNCSFQSCAARGGNSATGINGMSGGAGGGMRGNGIGSFNDGAGGGGFGGNGSLATAAIASFGGGASGFTDANTTTPGPDFNGGTTQGASGVGGGTSVQNGGFGGGGGTNSSTSIAGTGGFGGGGGAGGAMPNGGNGGFGGGGGSSSLTASTLGTGGFGGFGAGAGSSQVGTASSLFGGGDGNASGGGTGAGFGGAIFIQDGGHLTLQGSVSFSGNSVAAGTLGHPNTIASEGFGAMGSDIFMMSSAQLTCNLTTDLIMTSPIQGNQGVDGGSTTTGGLIKAGPALMKLTGANTYTGPTVVQAGELQINGSNASVVSDITVMPGATLSGNFTTQRNIPATGGGTITNSGIVSPGVNGVGTIFLHNYVQTASGAFFADITPTVNINDKLLLDMTGSGTLDGTLNIVVNNGNYIAGTQYTVISGTTTGQFATIVQSGSQAGAIDVSVSYGSVTLTVLTTQLFKHHTINPGVPTAVATAIAAEPISPNTDFSYVVTVLGTLSDPAVNQALIAMSPVMFGTLEWVNERNNSYVASLLTQHMFQLGCSPRDCQDKNNSVWGTVFGNTMNNYKTFDNLTPYSTKDLGALVGYDYCFPHFAFGLAGGYTYTDLNWKGFLGGGNLNSYYGAVYGSYHRPHFSLDASLLGGGNENDLKRKIIFSTINRTAKSDFGSYFATGHVGAQSDWTWGQGTFEPFALADYHYYNRRHVKETGADSIDLDIRAKFQQLMRGEAGVKAYYTVSHETSCYAPYIALSWVGEFPLEASHQKANFRGRPPVMNVKSYDSSIQLISPQLGFKATSGKGFSLIVGYKGLFNSKTSINEGHGRLEWVF